MKIHSQDYLGLGDNIYKIPFIYELSQKNEVYLTTPFPELFKFMNVRFCRPVTRLKTQLQNIHKHDKLKTWVQPEGQKLRMDYSGGLKGKGIIKTFEEFVPLSGWYNHLPIIEDGLEKAHEIRQRVPKDKKLCLVRLPTIRREWACPSRNPLPEYFNQIMDAYKDRFYFMSIGDVGIEEPLVGQYQGLDYEFHNKQLGLWETINLMKKADLVIAPPSFIIPLSIAYRFNAFIIYGGHVPHEVYIDERMDLGRIGYAQPNPFCNCALNDHNCNKEITNLLWRFDEYCHRVNLV